MQDEVTREMEMPAPPEQVWRWLAQEYRKRNEPRLAELARERFGLAGVAELAAEEAAVVAGEHGRLLT